MKKAIEYLKEAGVTDNFINPYHIKAMEEHTRQSIIDFKDWELRQGIRPTRDGYIQNSDKNPLIAKTTEQLFEKYMEYKKKHE